MLALLLASTTNMVSKGAAAFAGGRRFALRVNARALLVLAAACLSYSWPLA
jgi:uncharacterized membrane protein (DUF4010 family)